MSDVFISGVGMTSFGKYPDRTLRSLAGEAVTAALQDAGATASDVEMIVFANAVGGLITGQEMVRGEVCLQGTGLLGLPIVNVENACASSSSAVHLGHLAIASGRYETVLVVGAEKLTHPDKKVTFDAIATGADVTMVQKLALELSGGAPGGGAGSFFMDYYGDMGRRLIKRAGAERADLARVVEKNHLHGSLNPRAQYRNRITVQEVLDSRPISGPLTLLMCSPIGDGAAAVLLTSPRAARRFAGQPVRVRASVLTTGGGSGPRSPAERAAEQAYQAAGIGPEDVDLAEVHDAAAPAELVLYEKLGFCAFGDAGKLISSGDTRLGGRMPVNASGGLLAKGHPLGATGAAQLVELTEQLRGHAGPRQVANASVGLAENSGGHVAGGSAAAVVTIVSRD